ncbi:sigma-54 interaction domain-containing protein [Romboutsia lituseburensis]|uniref:sigma-54 interaction domain-containing protein n=1 Tax=Romboutsia lituseburensis TaxID=1537 RepID=UPI00215B594A|nr:sigma 54-interacting transcriptional regulator [Romboutsia lituseburensis]MCR8743854.1 sigma 54-interacting transcriptional regulator [Romboutsia lituseburensis]
MKKTTIISLGNETGNSLKFQLENILKENISINCYSIHSLPYTIECDLIVFSSKEVANIVLCKRTIEQKYVIVRRVIQYELIDKLFELDNNTNVLLVNDTKETCEIAIKQLIGHGVEHLIYHSYYPGIESYKNVEIAVTPGEEALMPKGIKKVINIGTRELDIVSIMEIIINLGDLEVYADLLSSYFFRKIVTQYKKYINLANKSSKLTSILSDILDNSIEGIIYTNRNDEVLVHNKVAREILGLSENITGKNIYLVCPYVKNDLITINDNEVFVSTKKIYSNNELMGYMIILETDSVIEKLDEERRRKRKQNKNNVKYTFNDMIGNNEKVLKIINLSKKISKTNSTILIQGESGTGKEILAQSIHNESDRCNHPFVAINFSALSDSLLESELFGYEEGAFTGAKKGGKVGLFKKAHKGTIFLDEIGDAPYHFQTRLLRVLQEREITPVGSSESIPIDVRIIAATNKDLVEEVRNKNFREDLFYRINVMPLYTISLRDRKDDIEILIKYYLRKLKVFTTIEDFAQKKVLDFFGKYNWPGNIRELVNVVEYLVNIKEDNAKITLEDLPKYMIRNFENDFENNNKIKFLDNKDYTLISENSINQAKINTLLENNYSLDKISDLSEDEIWVLKKMYLNEGIGRRSLCKISLEENLNLGEGKIRGILNKLRDKGYIEINKGLKGTKILDKGIRNIENGI